MGLFPPSIWGLSKGWRGVGHLPRLMTQADQVHANDGYLTMVKPAMIHTDTEFSQNAGIRTSREQVEPGAAM